MIPRMLEHQSVYVDVITGATASSVAVRQGVIEALTQAMEAAGTDPGEGLKAFQTVPEKKTGVTETINTGILVVGMGGSGTTAAMRAVEVLHELGATDVEVLAIDKAGKYGGTSSATTGAMAVNPPRFQEEHNDGKDYMDKAAMRKAWLEYTEGDAKEEILDKFLDNSGKVLDWLIYDHGFKFSVPVPASPPPMSTPAGTATCPLTPAPTRTSSPPIMTGSTRITPPWAGSTCWRPRPTT